MDDRFRHPFVIVAALAMAAPAAAHSWYDGPCCNLNDCRPIDGVEERSDGYHWHGVVIPYAKARQSLDSGFHACFRSDGVIRTVDDVPCFY